MAAAAAALPASRAQPAEPAGASAGAAEPTAPDTSEPWMLQECAGLQERAQRLACFDVVAEREAARPSPPAPPGEGRTQFQGLQAPGWLTRDWELDAQHKRGTFRFVMHRSNFILPVHYNNRTNSNPTSPSPGRTAELPAYRSLETKLQISLRTKLLQSVLLPDADLWFGYTQVSLWQLWSSNLSAPFRSTDYEPEVIYVVPVPQRWSALPHGWRWRFWQLGIAHQSNGQAKPLSRSWNRVYLAAGLEHGSLAAVVRAARRVREEAADDDNPDLTAYRGRGDVNLIWDLDLARVGLVWRTNFHNLDRGSLELNWTYPVGGSRDDGLRWYVQAFTGYAQTLLDYNFRQSGIGVGVTLFNF